MTATLHQRALQQLTELDSSVRLVVVNPNYLHHHRLLQYTLDHTPSAYVRLDGHGLTESEVNAIVNNALQAQVGTRSFAGLRVLLIDECDRVVPDGLVRYLSDLVPQMSSGHIVLLTRTMPMPLLSDNALRSVTQFIPTDEQLMLWDYSQYDAGQGELLEVRALGAGRVLLNGRAVTSWDGVLPRSLFFFLIERGMATRSDIFETFWPTLSTREATNVFHVTKRKISEVLGTDLTVYWSGFYHLSPRVRLSYDAALFSELVRDSAVVTDEQAVPLLEAAIGLYRSDFLESVDMSWASKRRQELRQTYGEALVTLAKANERAGHIQRALGLFLRAFAANRQREDLVQSAMRLYHQLGMSNDALHLYRQLEDELKRTLGVSPAPQLQSLAAAIRAEL